MLAGRIQQGASPQKPASEQTAGLMEALAGNDVVVEGRWNLRGFRGSEELRPHHLCVSG